MYAQLIGRIDAGGRTGRGGQWVIGQERRQVFADGDWTDARTTAAVRDAERLVQVQVRDVAAETARPGHPDQRVQICAVDVDLTAGRMDRVRQFGDRVLEDAVRRRVGHHHCCQFRRVLVDLG